MRVLSEAEAAPLIACVVAAGEVQHRLGLARINAPRLGKMGARPAVERDFPCGADYGLTGREVGWWGRLRAEGLSDKDAADVVKAARQEGASR